jgi:hypothetical protein
LLGREQAASVRLKLASAFRALIAAMMDELARRAVSLQ